MCGRFVVKDSTAALLPDLVSADFGGLRPNYNVAPTSPVTVVRERDGERSAPMVHEVSRDVNIVRTNGPHLLDPLPPAASAD